METEPRLRGIIHLVTAPVATLGGLTLVVLAGTLAGRVSLAIFMLTSALLFTTSAIYHRGRWVPRTKLLLRRLDHSNIFLIIAGTYTPLTVMLLEARDARMLLTLIWIGALGGVAVHNFWPTAPRFVYVPIYVALGWAALLYLPQFAAAGPLILGLVVAGGVLYTLGAVVYAIKRPQLNPEWFGFHELFHTLTVLAFTAHFIAIAFTMARTDI